MHRIVEQVKEQVKEQKELEQIMKLENDANDDVGASENNDDDYAIHPATSTSLWIYMYRCAKLGSRSLWKKKKNAILEEQIRSLCDKVIQYRLGGTKAGKNILDRKTNVPIHPNVVKCFCNMTDIMIATNPTLYTDIASKLNITFHDERVVCKAFSDFAEILFSKGTTWSLLVSLLTFSSCLAVECAKSGRSVLVRSISDWTTIFIIMHTREWIIENGKWNGVLKYFEPQKETSPGKLLDDLMLRYQGYASLIQWPLMVLIVCLVTYVLYRIDHWFYDLIKGNKSM